MPINLAPTTVMSLTVEGRLNVGGVSLYINRFHFTNSNFQVPTPEDLTDLIAAWLAGVQDTYLAMYTDAYTQQRLIAATVVDPERRKLVQYTVSPGTRALPVGGQYLPSFCAKVITWNSGLVSRRFNGKTFIGGALETDQDAGVFISSGAGNYVDLCAAWFDDMMDVFGNDGSSAFRLAILSDPDHVLPAQAATGLRPPVAATVESGNPYWDYVRTMKSRSIGRGA